jgi:hypothetical protein
MVALAGGALPPAGASAAAVCVNPLSAACHATIQGGVDAAGPGDIVKVAAGTYFENVNVPAGKDGLQITGSGKTTTILDPSPYVDAGKAGNNGPGIVIRSRNVTVKGLMIRNGQNYGISIEAAGALVQGVNITGPDVAGIIIEAAAWNVRILQNEIRSTSIGVHTGGFGALLQGNVITGSPIGINVSGAGSRVLGNRILNGQVGVFANGDGLVVNDNDIQHQSEDGIAIAGRFPTVQGNKVFGSVTGIDVMCVDCFGGSVASNVITDTTHDGILAAADDAGLVVQGNTLLRTGEGLILNGIGITARLNKATDVGAGTLASCFEVFGSLNTVAQNTATRCSQAGVYVNGDDMYVDRNVINGAFENGVTVDGESGGIPFARTAVVANKATGNGGQGVAVIGGAVDTLVTGNTATGNRHDFCDDGTSTDVGPNTFGTTHPDCLIAH